MEAHTWTRKSCWRTLQGSYTTGVSVNKLWRNGPEMPLRHAVVEEWSEAEIVPEGGLSKWKMTCSWSPSEWHSWVWHREAHQDSNFSSFSRLINVFTHVLKFCSILRRKTCPMAFNSNERKFVEILLIKETHVSLRINKNFPVCEKQLSLFADSDGILWCWGRIDDALDLPYLTN